MNRGCSVFFLAVILLLAGGFSGRLESQDVPRIRVDELRGKLGDPQVIVIDVRAAPDWENSRKKIAGAVREDPTEIAWVKEYDRAKTLVLYCA